MYRKGVPMPRFDFRAAIKWLAEVEWSCPTPIWHDSKEATENAARCPGQCGGTGRIVPFASLRMECRIFPHGDRFFHYCAGAPWCEDREWIPEPDVRVACWEIAKVRADAVRSESEAQRLADNLAEDSLLLDTEAWVKERHDLLG